MSMNFSFSYCHQLRIFAAILCSLRVLHITSKITRIYRAKVVFNALDNTKCIYFLIIVRHICTLSVIRAAVVYLFIYSFFKLINHSFQEGLFNKMGTPQLRSRRRWRSPTWVPSLQLRNATVTSTAINSIFLAQTSKPSRL